MSEQDVVICSCGLTLGVRLDGGNYKQRHKGRGTTVAVISGECVITITCERKRCGRSKLVRLKQEAAVV